MLKRYVIVGLDGVLSDPTGREVTDGDWDDYYALSRADPPFEDMITALNCMSVMGLKTIVNSERPERWRALTTSWLLTHRAHVDEVLHRTDDDFGSGPEVKFRMAEARFGSTAGILENVAFWVDSDERVVAMCQAIGLPALWAFPRRVQNDASIQEGRVA